MRDFKRLQEDPPAGVSGAPGENNIMLWNAVIFGPHGMSHKLDMFYLCLDNRDLTLILFLIEPKPCPKRSWRDGHFCSKNLVPAGGKFKNGKLIYGY